MTRSVTRPRTTPPTAAEVESSETFVNILADIENDARVTHDSDQRSLEQSRLRLDIHRTNLQRALRLVDGQIEAYDRMIQIAKSRAKEL